jgi:anthranilate synthase/aminodeoxychorismate synthase-like glutamine amidotransferase
VSARSRFLGAAAVLALIDNRDSFTYNLVQALAALGEEVEVFPARTTRLAKLVRRRPTRLLIGPGPGRPEAAELSLALLSSLARDVPTLGVCLGMQVLGHAAGARVARAREPVHGRAVPVEHDGRGLYHGIPSPFRCTRYNSLAVLEDGLPAELEVRARAADGDLMGLRHRTWPIEGVQFHPEALLSEHGTRLFANWLGGE